MARLALQNPYQPKAHWYKIQTHDHVGIMNRWDPGTHCGCWLPGELIQQYKAVGTNYVSIAGMPPRLACPSCGPLTYQRRDIDDSDLLVTESYNENSWITIVNNQPVSFSGAASTITNTLNPSGTYAVQNGAIVCFPSIIGTTGITQGVPYYIVNAVGVGNDGAGGAFVFQVALTPNGSPLTLTDDGTGTFSVLSYTVANHSDTDDDWWFLPYTLAPMAGDTPIPSKGTVPGSFQTSSGIVAPSGYVYTEGVDFTTSSTPITEFDRTRYVLSINFVDQAHLPADGLYIYPSYHVNISNQDLSGILWDYGIETTTNFANGHTSHDIVIGTIADLMTLVTGANVPQLAANCHALGLLFQAADCYLLTSTADLLSGDYDLTEVTNPDSGRTDWTSSAFAAVGQNKGVMGVDDTHSVSEFNMMATWVAADELTKEAIFEGLSTGNCYAARFDKILEANRLHLQSVTTTQDPSTVTITVDHPAIFQWVTMDSWPDRTVVPNTYPTPVKTTGTRWATTPPPGTQPGGGVLSDTYTVQPTDVFVTAVLTATPSIEPPWWQYAQQQNVIWITPLILLPSDTIYPLWDGNESYINGLFNVRLAG